MAPERRVLVPVPGEVGLAYDGRGWCVVSSPPAWWWEEQDALLVEDARRPADIASGSGSCSA